MKHGNYVEPSTQNLKLKAYSGAGLNVDWIHFVPVDFTHESWSKKLVESGFDPTKRTFWLWEGVTLYLEESVVRNTLKEIGRLSAAGSRATFDFYSLVFVNLEGLALIRAAAKQMLKMAGEPLKFGIDTKNNVRANIMSLLEETTLSIQEFPLLGRDQNNAFAGVVEVIKG